MTEQTGSSSTDALAPFRPKRGRAVALGVVWTSLAVFGVIAVVMPAQAGGRWGVGDRLMFFGLGVAIAFVAWRYASIVAVPSREGLVVRNLVLTRSLEWPEIDRRHGLRRYSAAQWGSSCLPSRAAQASR